MPKVRFQRIPRLSAHEGGKPAIVRHSLWAEDDLMPHSGRDIARFEKESSEPLRGGPYRRELAQDARHAARARARGAGHTVGATILPRRGCPTIRSSSVPPVVAPARRLLRNRVVASREHVSRRDTRAPPR